MSGTRISIDSIPVAAAPIDTREIPSMADATTAPTSGSAPSAREQFLDTYLREHATTEKVLRAFPPSKQDFRPHERSSSALKLAWTFVVEQRMMLAALKKEQVIGSGFAPTPATWGEVLEVFAAQHEEVVRRLRGAGDEDLDGTVQFFTGPKQLGDYATREFLWFMLGDQIHHRGQLSVYVRMAGGKVPSIYGPSADEPWN